MKKLILLLILTLFTFAKDVYMIGYIPPYRISALEIMDISGLTHVIAAFANPDSSGNMSCPIDLDYFSETVIAGGSSPVISIGGGGSYSWGADTTVYSHLYADSNRTMFVNKLVEYTKEFNASGIDVDIEGAPLMHDLYDPFVQELADSLHANDLEIYSAFGVGAYAGASHVDDLTLSKFDIIGTMSYGGVDQWNWNRPEHPATVERFISDVQYFIDRGVDPSKIAGGVPFYTVGFPAERQNNYSGYFHTLNQMHSDSFYINQNPFYNDTLINRDGMPEYTNSFTSMKKKIDHAASIGAGIMIWELGQDNYNDGPNMLDSMISYISEPTAVPTETTQKSSQFSVHQNSSELSVTLPQGSYNLNIFSISGKLLHQQNLRNSAGSVHLVSLSNFARGFMFMQINQGAKTLLKQKIVKL